MKRSPLLVIFITVFIDLIGFGIVIPVLPYYASATGFGATPRQVGLLFASYSVMQLVFAPVLGRLSDKYGRRPVLLVSILGTCAGFLILGFATTLWMLFVGRIIDGISGGNISTAQAYIADVTTKENRAKGMGLIGAAFGLGFVFGPAIGGILSRWGINVPFLFAGGLAFANAILLYFTLPETVTPDHPARVSAASGRGWKQLIDSLKRPRLGFVLTIYFLSIVAFSIMTASFSLFLMFRLGYDAWHNGWIFAFVGIISATEQGTLLRVTRSVASIARAVGPSIAAFLVYSLVAHASFNVQSHYMCDASIRRTFWSAAAIQFVACLLAVYFARAYGEKYSAGEIAEAA